MSRDRILAALLLVLALSVGAGCSAGGADTSGSSTQTSTDDSSAQDGSSSEEESGAEGGGSEESGPVSEQETSDDEEAAAGGGGGVSVELAGLPVGGGSTTAVGEAWCQALFWGSQLPAGVLLEIDAVQVGEPGGTLQDVGCEDEPPCVGATISDDQRGCAVAVVPPSPAPELMRVRLDGTLRCPDQATCDQVVLTDGVWVPILPPIGGDPTEEAGSGDTTQETEVGDPTEETGSGDPTGETEVGDPTGETGSGDGASVDPGAGAGEVPAPTGS